MIAAESTEANAAQVPLDQPEVALDLYQKWLFQKSF
jgi:hypothetical protein